MSRRQCFMGHLPPGTHLLPSKDAERLGCLTLRTSGEGRWVGVVLKLLGQASVAIGTDRGFWDDMWDYATVPEALAAWIQWDAIQQAEPEAWIRHPATMRRREEGDPAREEVRP